jgi:hypothetical protein
MSENEKFAENVTKSAASMAKAKDIIASTAASDHVLEAAGNAEEIIAWLQSTWADKGFTFEQSVFAIALVTINLRETVPDKFGSKAAFDRIAGEARAYYDKNR